MFLAVLTLFWSHGLEGHVPEPHGHDPDMYADLPLA